MSTKKCSSAIKAHTIGAFQSNDNVENNHKLISNFFWNFFCLLINKSSFPFTINDKRFWWFFWFLGELSTADFSIWITSWILAFSGVVLVSRYHSRTSHACPNQVSQKGKASRNFYFPFFLTSIKNGLFEMTLWFKNEARMLIQIEAILMPLFAWLNLTNEKIYIVFFSLIYCNVLIKFKSFVF